MEKLIDELARGRKMEKILREEKKQRPVLTKPKLYFNTIKPKLKQLTINAG